ncbi:hypothetical protein QYS49_22345 [Marivirga salinae]|uniref:Uncharacterized protein n=1 Tax=Marivirga salinarum TaxID=3059078 RepID=A0AA49GAP6_9BACT|nr:hypothetical protein [Marivirga sp. BDSF4-3]WKK74458.2 hypothetical protein QYS49_22345 [Marivirga sp. BDSF4-3]
MKNQMYLMLFFSVLIGSLFHSVEIKAQELGKYIEQYEGRKGARTFRVKLLRIGEKENEEVLIQISGVDDPISGKIYKYKKEWQRSEKRFKNYQYVTTQIPDKERFATLHSNTQYGSQVLKVYLIDNPSEAISIYPTEYQKNLDPLFMYDQYKRQMEEVKK